MWPCCLLLLNPFILHYIIIITFTCLCDSKQAASMRNLARDSRNDFPLASITSCLPQGLLASVLYPYTLDVLLSHFLLENKIEMHKTNLGRDDPVLHFHLGWNKINSNHFAFKQPVVNCVWVVNDSEWRRAVWESSPV
jgi:hypothetical protein